jgi:hypothetical protein
MRPYGRIFAPFFSPVRPEGQFLGGFIQHEGKKGTDPRGIPCPFPSVLQMRNFFAAGKEFSLRAPRLCGAPLFGCGYAALCQFAIRNSPLSPLLLNCWQSVPSGIKYEGGTVCWNGGLSWELWEDWAC